MTSQETCQMRKHCNKECDFQQNMGNVVMNSRYWFGNLLGSLPVKIPEAEQTGLSGSLGITGLQKILKCQCFWPSLQEKANVGIFMGRGIIPHSILLKWALLFENGWWIPPLRKEKGYNHCRWRVGASVAHGCPSSTHSFCFASVSGNIYHLTLALSQQILLSFCDTNWRASLISNYCSQAGTYRQW